MLSVTRRQALLIAAGLGLSSFIDSSPALADEVEEVTDVLDDCDRVANSFRYRDGEPIVEDDDFGVMTLSSVVPWGKDEAGNWCNNLGEPIPGALLRGVDVSSHQGKIDWEAAKKDGVDFAIIRAAWSTPYTNSKGEYQNGIDSYWECNVSECERLGIPYGAYIYSYATQANYAVEYADHILKLLEGHTPSYPIYIDIEDESTRYGNLNAVAKAFCERVEDAGLRAGVYASKSWFTDYLASSELDQWSKWVAQYYSECTYAGSYDMWQASSSTEVDGIGRVDINFDFVGLADAPLPLYRLYNPNDGQHHYTLSVNERNVLSSIGWVYEGIGWKVPASSSTPVYRLYNPNSGDHHYTTSLNEYKTLGDIGWVCEGIAWYSNDKEGAPLYRLFNPNETVGTHHYTLSVNERDTLSSIGWIYEGIAWYGLA